MTRAAITIQAEARTGTGKGAARALRREHKIPAILYGAGKEPLPVTLPLKEVMLHSRKEGFMNTLVHIVVGKDSYDVLPREVQTHPVTDFPEHADFLLVDKKSTVRVFVPVHFRNQATSIGIKRGGVLNIVRHEVELVCLPTSIPEYLEIDVKDGDIGHSYHISGVTLPEGVTPAIRDRDFTIATIAGRQKEEEEIKPAAGAADSVAGGAAAPAAGAAAAKPAAAAKDEKK